YEIVLLVPVPLYSPGDRIVPSQVASDVYLRGGWHERGKEEIRWSSEEAVIEFSLTTTQLLHLRMMANTYQFEQPVIVRLNGQTVGTLRGDGGPLRLMELAMPSEAVHEDNTLTLVMPEATSPRKLGVGDDERTLGLQVAWVELVP